MVAYLRYRENQGGLKKLRPQRNLSELFSSPLRNHACFITNSGGWKTARGKLNVVHRTASQVTMFLKLALKPEIEVIFGMQNGKV